MRRRGGAVLSILVVSVAGACARSPYAAPTPLATPAVTVARGADVAVGPCDVLRQARAQRPPRTSDLGTWITELMKYSLDVQLRFAEVSPPELDESDRVLIDYYRAEYESKGEAATPPGVEEAETTQENWAREHCPGLDVPGRDE